MKPSEAADARRITIPELKALRELRHVLARGGLRGLNERAPEDHVRIAMFGAIADLLRLMDEFKRRVEGGERCRLVKVQHSPKAGRLLIEIEIEPQP